MGYGGTGDGAAHALGKTGDNGVDGVIDQDPLGVDQIYIQAKRYTEGNNIGSGDIISFGALNLKRASKGIFISTSNFTASAIKTANDLGNRIVLINGKELAK
jgi:restriction system protein